MASLIKNQIIKHLSTFARNLTPDQISVEVLRGKGELKNIELNEVVLTERLELPSWLKIVRATCNRVSVKVPWTKLKMSAVELSIDEIEVVLSLSAASPTAVPKKANTRSGKAYDFGERVIEGLSISVQTLSVHFTSDCFGGSIMFQRLSVASKSPQFKNQADLHLTRVHDKSINQLIFFKQVSWEMCKIEASALHGSDVKVDADDTPHNALNSPLRLIMHNGGKCKIAIKKNDLNCSMISARIEVHLDEILWVATLLQLRSAIDFYKHIQNLVKASEQDNVGSFLIDMPQQKQNANVNTTNLSAKPTATNPISLAFQKYDIPRSSHHFRISKIDLCLFDDSNDNVLPTDWDINNGAIQAVLHELCVDYYPSHAVFVNGAFADRSDWVKYNAFNSCRGLTERHLNNYYAKICENFELGLSARIQRVWPSLHSRNVVLRIEDIVVQCVSEQKTTKDSIQQLFAPSKLRRFADMPSIPTISFLHMEFASYYFLASNGYPLPPDTSHLVIGPLDFLADGRSIRWMVYVFENIFNAFDESLDMLATANQPYFCAEFVEPTVIFNAPQLTDDFRLPTRFLLNFSSVSVCNFLLPTPTTSSSQPLTIGDLAFSPFNALARLTAKCRAFAAGRQSTLSRYLDFGELMKRVDLFGDAVDYANSIDSVYRTIDDIRLYVNIPSLSFVSDFGWNSFETPIVTDSSLLIVVAPQKPIGAALVHLRSDVLVTVDHFQLVRLIQLQNQISDLVDQIDNDRRFFAGHNTVPTMADESANDNFSFAVLCDLRNVNVSLVLPIAPLPSPYDITWSLPSMTLENTPDSIATPPIIDSKPRLNEVKSQLSDRGPDLELNKTDNRSDRSLTNPFLDETDDVETGLVEVADIVVEQTQMAELSLKNLRNCTSVASLNNFAVGRASSSSISHQQAMVSACSALFSMAPPESITELRPSSRQVLSPTGGFHRAEFFTGSLPSAEADRISLFDDSASLSIPDYQRLLIDDVDKTSTIGEIDGGAAGSVNGRAEDAELAEEADAMDERNRWANVRQKSMARCVNVLNANLGNVGAAVVIYNGGGATTVDGAHTNIFIVGDVSTVSVGERLGKVFGDLFKDNTQNATESRTRTTTMIEEPVGAPKEVHFQVRINQRKETLIEVDADGAGKSFKLSDDVVSQLAPFLENTELDEESPNPPELRLNVSNLNVEIKNPKRKHPLRIRLGSVIAINDGPTFENADFS